MRRSSIVIAVVALMLAVTPAATANPVMLEAELAGVGGPNFDPTDVALRCPEGFEWIYSNQGLGTLETAAFSGDVALTGQHCSRWLIAEPEDPDKSYLGRVGSGVMTLYTDEGNLVLTYRGKFTFQGDLSIEPPEFVSLVMIFYKIDGDMSTGVFEGASGVGQMKVIDKLEAGVPSFTAELRGPIHFAK